MQKRVTVRIAGPKGEQISVDTPSTSVHELLAELGLREHQLIRADGGLFDPRDTLYEQIADGQVLYAFGIERGC